MYMLGATVLFAGSTALSKWQVATYPFSEVLLFRSAVSLIVCALLIMPWTGMAVFRTQRIGAHFGRSVTQTAAQSCILIALSMMPIAGAMAINFSAPLFATLFAAFFLGERVGLPRASALVVGFCGVLLVASPGADSFRRRRDIRDRQCRPLRQRDGGGARHEPDRIGRNAHHLPDGLHDAVLCCWRRRCSASPCRPDATPSR